MKETIKQLLKVYFYISDGEKFRAGLHNFHSTCFYQQTAGVPMGGRVSSTTVEIYMHTHEQATMSTALHPPKDWRRFVDDVYSILKPTNLENVFHYINNLCQNIKFTMEENRNGKRAFLDTLLKQNNGKIFVLVYRNPMHTNQFLHVSSHHQTSCKESVVSSLFNRAYYIITNMMTWKR